MTTLKAEPTTPLESSTELSKKQSIGLIIGLLCGVLLEAFDANMLNPSMQTISRELGGTLQSGPWVITTYLIALTVMTPIYGRLSDLFGRLPFYAGGMALFMVGSILSGLSQNLSQLIFFRLVQGLGAGAMMPIAITIAQTVFPPQQRGKVQGIIPMAFGIAAIVGLPLGGMITETIGWRWLFYLNLPFGLLALFLIWSNLPQSARFRTNSTDRKNLDIWGMVTLIGASVGFMLGMNYLKDPAVTLLSTKVVISFSAFVVLFAAFVYRESTYGYPLISLKFFKNPTFSLSVFVAFLTGGIMLWSTATYLSIYMQAVLQAGSTRSGTVLTPFMIAMAIGSIFSGRSLGGKLKKYKYLALLASSLTIAGASLMLFLGTENSQLSTITPMILMGLGIGITFPLYGMVAASQVDKQFAGLTFGVIAFFRNLGGAMALALYGIVFSRALDKNLTEKIPPGWPTTIKEKILQGFSGAGEGTSSGVQHIIPPWVKGAISDSIHQVFIGILLVAIIAWLAALMLPNKTLNSPR